MNRRGFIGSILAAAVAPAIVRADSLMRIVPRDALILTPEAVTAERLGRLANRTLYVHSGALGLGTGENWVNAFTSLKMALVDATSGETIYVDSDHIEVTSGGIAFS